MSNVRWIVRFPSGAVEHRYGTTPPQVGDAIGRNGSRAFVTSVTADERGVLTVIVGTDAPPGVTWEDLAPPDSPASKSERRRILEAADELFSTHGIRAVEVDELIAAAEVSAEAFSSHFAAKEDLVLAFLQRREQQWTRAFVEAEARRRGNTPRDRLLAIFDVFDEWFHRDDFEGCSFINVLLETTEREDPVRLASAAHLEYIRSVVRRLAEEAGMSEHDAGEFAHSWHILMKGSIVTAGEGDQLAAQRAKGLGVLLLDRYLTQTDDIPAAEAVLESAALKASA
jgi:AcrR family transcriptional regulator